MPFSLYSSRLEKPFVMTMYSASSWVFLGSSGPVRLCLFHVIRILISYAHSLRRHSGGHNMSAIVASISCCDRPGRGNVVVPSSLDDGTGGLVKGKYRKSILHTHTHTHTLDVEMTTEDGNDVSGISARYVGIEGGGCAVTNGAPERRPRMAVESGGPHTLSVVYGAWCLDQWIGSCCCCFSSRCLHEKSPPSPLRHNEEEGCKYRTKEARGVWPHPQTM